VCGLVPLLDLGEQVKATVQRAARIAGITLASVSVHIAALTSAQEQ